jgi:recombination protein RecA
MAKKKVEAVETHTLSASDKKRALQATMNAHKKTYGAEAFVSHDRTVTKRYDVIPTGSARLDDIIGIGGLPRGRIVEIYGGESSGKTTTVTQIAIQAQKHYPDDHVAIVDVEHAFDPYYAEDQGFDMDNCALNQPDSGDEALNLVLSLVESGACSVVILDSVAGLVSKRELEKGSGEDTIGEVARLMSQHLKKIKSAASKTNTLVIYINQIRMKIGQMFGNPETTPGGRALPFYASVRLEVKKIEPIMKGDEPLGQVVRYRCVKNKVSRPFRKVDTNMYFYTGFDSVAEVSELAIEKGLISRAGAYYDLFKGTEDEVRIQGKPAVTEYLRENEDKYERIHTLVFADEMPAEDIPEQELDIDLETGEVLGVKNDAK